MRKPSDPKAAALQADGALNPHPEAVRDELFQASDFFDSRDMVQVKYEMLRRVRVDGQTVTQTVSDFGFSRPTFYEARAAFAQDGLAGLMPKKKGPRRAHKLTDEVLDFLGDEVVPGEPLRARALSDRVKEHFGVTIHPRTIERAFRPPEKKRR